MDKKSLQFLRNRLDSAVLSMSKTVKDELYSSIILPTAVEWFDNNDTVIMLNDKIKKNVNDRLPFIEKKLKSQLLDFEEQTNATLSKSAGLDNRDIDVKKITDDLSESIAMAIGTIGTVIVGMIAGGSGTALIAGGPIGWIIGAIVAGSVFFLGKEVLEEEIGEYISHKSIPPFVKKLAKNKVVSQLKMNEAKFEEDVYNMLQEQVKPIYEAIDGGL